MADAEDIQPLVCDNGTGMVKVSRISYSIEGLRPVFSSQWTGLNLNLGVYQMMLF